MVAPGVYIWWWDTRPTSGKWSDQESAWYRTCGLHQEVYVAAWKEQGLVSGILEFISLLCHFLPLKPSSCYLTALCFSFLFCQVEIIAVPTSLGRWKDWRWYVIMVMRTVMKMNMNLDIYSMPELCYVCTFVHMKCPEQCLAHIGHLIHYIFF